MTDDEAADIRTFRLDSTGLRRVLGTLEADILEAVWSMNADTNQIWTTIGAVCQRLGPATNYKTVQTVMNRLVEKHFLRRRQRTYPYEYQATLTRDELIMQVTRAILGGLVQDFGEIAVSQALHTLTTVDEASLALLTRLAQGPDPAAPMLPVENQNDDQEEGD